MADEKSQDEKTEEPTPKRLEKAREEGQVARSRELTTMMLLLGGGLTIAFSAGYLMDSMKSVMAQALSGHFLMKDSPLQLLEVLEVLSEQALLGILPILVGCFLVSLLSPLALGGWLLSAKSLLPKGSRISPIAGVKRMFSRNSLMELVKSVAKVTVVVACSFVVLSLSLDSFIVLGDATVAVAIRSGLTLVGVSFLGVACSMGLIAAVDVPFQIAEHRRKLKMTLQEIKDEMRDTEGKPEVKSKVRQLRHEIASRRMMSSVETADVVITNPTHYSVALKYADGEMNAPTVVAKGVDLVAFRIRELARSHDVTLFASPMLARAIYHHADIGQEVPAGLYGAVAQILAYVYQLRAFRKGQAARPKQPRNIDVPPDYRSD